MISLQHSQWATTLILSQFITLLRKAPHQKESSNCSLRMPWIADSQTKNPSYHCLSSIHTHLDAPSFLIGYKPNSVVSKVNLITCDPLVIILTSLCPDRRNQSWFTQIKLQPLSFVILLCWPRSLISPSRFVIKSTQPWGVVTVECRGRCDVPIRNLTIFDTNWHRVTSCIRKW